MGGAQCGPLDRPPLGRNEELDIAFRAGDRAFDDPLDSPAAAFEPRANLVAHAFVQRRVAHHAPFADFLAPDFELRLDQRHQPAVGSGELERAFEHLAQADERSVAHHPVAGPVDLLASENAVKVAGEAIQALGGAGYTKDWSVERYWRDAKLLDIGAGTNEIRRMLIGRELIGAGA